MHTLDIPKTLSENTASGERRYASIINTNSNLGTDFERARATYYKKRLATPA